MLRGGDEEDDGKQELSSSWLLGKIPRRIDPRRRATGYIFKSYCPLAIGLLEYWWCGIWSDKESKKQQQGSRMSIHLSRSRRSNDDFSTLVKLHSIPASIQSSIHRPKQPIIHQKRSKRLEQVRALDEVTRQVHIERICQSRKEIVH